jgi:uncharacterized membrane protein
VTKGAGTADIPPSGQSLVRLAIGATVGLLASWLVPARHGVALRLVGGWDGAALAILAMAWRLIAPASAAATRRHAAADDPGRALTSLLWVFASTFSLVATALVLRRARLCPPDVRALLVSLGMLAVASSWVVTHTILTLRYAHLYYRDGAEREGGLDFPGEGHPAFLDFAYFAFTIGMCFQVSDVAISSSRLRRTALGHAMLAFAYNTVILAIAVNLAIGIFG